MANSRPRSLSASREEYLFRHAPPTNAELFAASNREAVAVGLWPFSVALDLPLYLAILLTFFVGLLCGALAAWVGGRHWRREARQRRRRVTALEHELEATQAQLAGTAAPPSPEMVPPRAPANRSASVRARG